MTNEWIQSEFYGNDWKYSYFLVQFVSGLSQQQAHHLLHISITYMTEHHRSGRKQQSPRWNAIVSSTPAWFTTCVWNNMIKASEGAEGQTSAPANPPVSSPVTSMQRLWPRLLDFRLFPPKSATFLPEPLPSRTVHFEVFWSWTPGLGLSRLP